MIRPIAACLIALGATALAWLFGRQTDQEREWHDELNRRNEKARNAYQAAPNTDVREQALVREQAAMQLKADYETYCLQFRTRWKDLQRSLRPWPSAWMPIWEMFLSAPIGAMP